VVGASGKLGQYLVQHALDRGCDVVGVCRKQSVAKLDAFKGHITLIPGATHDRDVMRKAVAGCDRVLTVLAPRGVHGYSTGRLRPCSTRRGRARALCSPAAGTSPVTVKTSTRAGSSGR
jgi:nucleoside-diphosphate-sugar epimerase